MNKKQDVFSDLEKDLEGDWKKIQIKIRNEKAKEIRLQEPKRPYFPSFRKFYKILVDIAYGDNEFDLKYTIQRLISYMFYYDNNKLLPRSIENLWEAICKPDEFECSNQVSCGKCNNIYDIIYKPIYKNRSYYIREFGTAGMYGTTMKYFRVHCPTCGYVLTNIANAELVSVSLSPKDIDDDEYRRERRYDIKREF